MTYLLDLVGRHKGHGVRHRILKVTTIPRLMTEVVEAHANFPQLATRGNNRAVAAQDTDAIYSRNVAQHQISVSNFPQNARPI